MNNTTLNLPVLYSMMNLCGGFRDGFGEPMKDLYLCNYSNKVVFITHNRAHKAERRNTFAEYRVLCLWYCVVYNRKIISASTNLFPLK